MMVGAVAPNFAESVQAVALGASGVQSQGLLAGSLRSCAPETRAHVGSQGEGSLSLAPGSPRLGRGLSETAPGFAGPRSACL